MKVRDFIPLVWNDEKDFLKKCSLEVTRVENGRWLELLLIYEILRFSDWSRDCRDGKEWLSIMAVLINPICMVIFSFNILENFDIVYHTFLLKTLYSIGFLTAFPSHWMYLLNFLNGFYFYASTCQSSSLSWDSAYCLYTTIPWGCHTAIWL